MSKGFPPGGYGFRGYIKPALESLAQDGAIDMNSYESMVIIRPETWKILSDFSVDQRRHDDMISTQNVLIYVTAILAFTAIINILLAFQLI